MVILIQVNYSCIQLKKKKSLYCFSDKEIMSLFITILSTIGCRNDIPVVTPCGNSYECPKHSLQFHKFRSTRPGMNFSLVSS